jgi:hypothetical protein
MTETSSPFQQVRERATSREEVPWFLDAFFELFAARDVESLAQLWDVPALVIGDEGVQAALSLADVERLFDDATPPSVRHASEEAKLASPSARAVLDWVSSKVVMAHVPWPQGVGRGFLAGVENVTLLLRLDDDARWKIHGLMVRAGTAPGSR